MALRADFRTETWMPRLARLVALMPVASGGAAVAQEAGRYQIVTVPDRSMTPATEEPGGRQDTPSAGVASRTMRRPPGRRSRRHRSRALARLPGRVPVHELVLRRGPGPALVRRQARGMGLGPGRVRGRARGRLSRRDRPSHRPAVRRPRSPARRHRQLPCSRRCWSGGCGRRPCTCSRSTRRPARSSSASASGRPMPGGTSRTTRSSCCIGSTTFSSLAGRQRSWQLAHQPRRV